MRFKNKLTALFIFFIVLVVLISFFDRIMIYAVSKAYDFHISYSGLENRGYREFIFTDLKVFDEKHGIGTVSEYAQLKPKFKHIFAKDMTVDFHLSRVRFVRNESEIAETYDTLSSLVYTPFASRWFYKEISGKIDMFEKGVRVKDFLATSDDIRTSLTGTIYYDNNLELKVVIYFSNKLLTKIPDPLSKVVLKDEEVGWKSLSVNLKGNYKAPSIEVSGRLFRLNIGGLSSRE